MLRLGRTARAGKEGEGVLLLHPDEFRFMNSELADMPVRVIPPESIKTHKVEDKNMKPDVEALSLMIKTKASMNNDEVISAWQAWVGFYNGQTKRLGWTTQCLLQESKKYAVSIGLKEAPALSRRVLSKMGLTKAGFRCIEDSPRRVTNNHGHHRLATWKGMREPDNSSNSKSTRSRKKLGH